MIPSESIPAFTRIEGRSVALRPDPKVYAPAEKSIRCQGISTSFHLTTPIPGIRATIAPIKATVVSSIPCNSPVIHIKRTPTNIAMDLYSSTVIFPIETNSCLSLSIPPSIWGFFSSGFIGNIIFTPTNQPKRRRTIANGKPAASQSEYPNESELYAPIIRDTARRFAPEPVMKALAPIFT